MGSMLDLDITITLYDKAYAEDITAMFKRHYIPKPVYIVELTNSCIYEFNSDYHQYELQNEIAALFEGYEFTEHIGASARIVLKIHIIQSPFSSDNWGRRWNEDAIETTRYLVKLGKKEPDIPKTRFHVLFHDQLKEYKVHLGVSKTEFPYYVVLKDDFTTTDKIEFLSSRQFATPGEAFWEGYRLLAPTIEEDFENYLKELKKAQRKRKKSPQSPKQ